MDLDTAGTRETPRRFLRALFDATAGYDGDPKLRTAFPAERPDGVEGAHGADRRGPDRLLLALRAPRAAVPRRRVHRLCRRRRDPRHLEADAAGAALRAAVHGAGAARRADRGQARRARAGARRRRQARGGAPVHRRCAASRRTARDGHDVLARPVRRGRRLCGASSSLRCVIRSRLLSGARRTCPARTARRAAGVLRRRARLRRAVRRRELRRDARRRRRVPRLRGRTRSSPTTATADRFVIGLLRALADAVV